MDYELEKAIERIDGNFVCVFHGQSALVGLWGVICP